MAKNVSMGPRPIDYTWLVCGFHALSVPPEPFKKLGSLENEKKRCLVLGCVVLCACCKNLERDFLLPNKGFHAGFVDIYGLKKKEGDFKIAIQRCKFRWVNWKHYYSSNIGAYGLKFWEFSFFIIHILFENFNFVVTFQCNDAVVILWCLKSLFLCLIP